MGCTSKQEYLPQMLILLQFPYCCGTESGEVMSTRASCSYTHQSFSFGKCSPASQNTFCVIFTLPAKCLWSKVGWTMVQEGTNGRRAEAGRAAQVEELKSDSLLLIPGLQLFCCISQENVVFLLWIIELVTLKTKIIYIYSLQRKNTSIT